MAQKTRVIIVDDSQVMRDLIAQIVRSQPDMEVAATAQDPFDAREKIKALRRMWCCSTSKCRAWMG